LLLQPLGTNRSSNLTLRTLALRPNVMYGEGDPYYVTAGLKAASTSGGVMYRVGDGSALFQQAYVGNIAWAHVRANQALALEADIGGQVSINNSNNNGGRLKY
jgi:3beta-hydroxy-delta5-steroid dehydrogenase / steroid delta-isomerase